MRDGGTAGALGREAMHGPGPLLVLVGGGHWCWGVAAHGPGAAAGSGVARGGGTWPRTAAGGGGEDGGPRPPLCCYNRTAVILDMVQHLPAEGLNALCKQ